MTLGGSKIFTPDFRGGVRIFSPSENVNLVLHGTFPGIGPLGSILSNQLSPLAFVCRNQHIPNDNLMRVCTLYQTVNIIEGNV